MKLPYRRMTVAGAVMSCLTVAFLTGAAAWRLAQTWPPLGAISLVLMAVFIVWQTQVTMRLQTIVRRAEDERRYMDRVTDARRIAREMGPAE